jgi:hypothetical protein
MLRDLMSGERPPISSADAASVPILSGANSFIDKHFWLTVNFPAMAPGTPDSAACCPLRAWPWRVSQFFLTMGIGGSPLG